MLALVLQARDNVKFLTTLERHFRSISSGSMTGILDTLPLLMNALRMIWIISHYYSDDAHMGALFARIANELCDRVNGAIMLHTLFRMPADEAMELLRVSKAVLECWQSTYMQVCWGFCKACVQPPCVTNMLAAVDTVARQSAHM